MSGSSKIIDGRLVERQGRAPRELAAFAAAFPALATGAARRRSPEGRLPGHRGREHESVEVVASHLGLGANPLAVSVVWDRLARQESQRRPYLGLDRAMAGA